MPYTVSAGPISGNTPRAPVGDRMLPKRYEMLFEPDDDEPGPAQRLVFEVLDGVPQCREIHLTATERGREVRRADLRIPLEDYLELATLTVAQPLRESRRADGRVLMTLDPSGRDAFRRTMRSARRTALHRGPGESELREAAAVYQSADRAPTQAVAAKFGIAHRTASLWIARARKLGYL